MKQKKEFMAAYNWMVKAQRACLLKDFSTEVYAQYCEPNLKDGAIDAWSLEFQIYPKEKGGKIISAKWTAWAPGVFEKEKAEVIDWLAENGIVIK